MLVALLSFWGRGNLNKSGEDLKILSGSVSVEFLNQPLKKLSRRIEGLIGQDSFQLFLGLCIVLGKEVVVSKQKAGILIARVGSYVIL